MGAIKRCIRLPLNSSNVQLVTDSMEQEFGLKRYDLKSCVQQLVHALRHVNCTTIGDFVGFIRDCSDAVRVKDPLTAAFAVKQRHGHLVVGDGEHFVDYNGLVTMVDPISNVCVAMNNINYYSTRELEANAKIMRNRRKELWKRTGTGEDLFMSIEEILRKSSCTSSTYTARAKDPVLVIDSVRRQNRYAVLGDVLKL
ncbi:22.3 kDa [Spodoptera frugiperda ascovirus 1a]|uniref:22.3 kDa n=1 Tax=Spodoptera frugiperda ascovirus 1a TaxID=113370 RepID=Q0E4Z6_SFAVA|nr:22.3 kDa [Spodoptera frugiperda ascovirus 1a]CAL44705.1 22.3 kDa [Spodoptera frugiperda ascovirus 1a]